MTVVPLKVIVQIITGRICGEKITLVNRKQTVFNMEMTSKLKNPSKRIKAYFSFFFNKKDYRNPVTIFYIRKCLNNKIIVQIKSNSEYDMIQSAVGRQERIHYLDACDPTSRKLAT